MWAKIWQFNELRKKSGILEVAIYSWFKLRPMHFVLVGYAIKAANTSDASSSASSGVSQGEPTRRKPLVARMLFAIRQFGLPGVVCVSLYRVAPKQFTLVKNVILAPIGETGYNIRAPTVFDYWSWSDIADTARRPKPKDSRPCFIWFVPDWTNVWGGGHYTLFRFANYFAQQGTRNIIYIYNNQRHANPTALQATLDGALSPCRIEVVTDPSDLPPCAAAIATTWQSAYYVRALTQATTKFYFMQDYESQFYSHGTASVQANNTYSFGFKGITGGSWLRECYARHGGEAVNYVFAADREIFYPANSRAEVRQSVDRLFFYGRPSTERRCFDLGIVALQEISRKYAVEIVIAGLDLQFKPPFRATLLGNMALKDTGDLYRTCDVGMAFSGTNLSYLPVELMASGVPVISNRGENVEWFCRDGENAVLVDPTPKAVVAAFDRLYNDRGFRQKIVDGGQLMMKDISWNLEMQKIYEYICKGIGKPDFCPSSALVRAVGAGAASSE